MTVASCVLASYRIKSMRRQEQASSSLRRGSTVLRIVHLRHLCPCKGKSNCHLAHPALAALVSAVIGEPVDRFSTRLKGDLVEQMMLPCAVADTGSEAA